MEEKKTMMQEFKEFISRGNVIDLAVGMVIGAAFSAIVGSLVNDIVMPVIGLILGGVNFANLKILITPADEAAGIAEAAIYYGNFIQQIVNFFVIAFVIFLVVKGINKFRAMTAKNEEAAEEPAPEEPAPSAEEVLLTEIRDLLKKE